MTLPIPENHRDLAARQAATPAGRLLAEMGMEYYHTESAARFVAEHCADVIEALRQRAVDREPEEGVRVDGRCEGKALKAVVDFVLQLGAIGLDEETVVWRDEQGCLYSSRRLRDLT